MNDRGNKLIDGIYNGGDISGLGGKLQSIVHRYTNYVLCALSVAGALRVYSEEPNESSSPSLHVHYAVLDNSVDLLNKLKEKTGKKEIPALFSVLHELSGTDKQYLLEQQIKELEGTGKNADELKKVLLRNQRIIELAKDELSKKINQKHPGLISPDATISTDAFEYTNLDGKTEFSANIIYTEGNESDPNFSKSGLTPGTHRSILLDKNGDVIKGPAYIGNVGSSGTTINNGGVAGRFFPRFTEVKQWLTLIEDNDNTIDKMKAIVSQHPLSKDLNLPKIPYNSNVTVDVKSEVAKCHQILSGFKDIGAGESLTREQLQEIKNKLAEIERMKTQISIRLISDMNKDAGYKKFRDMFFGQKMDRFLQKIDSELLTICRNNSKKAIEKYLIENFLDHKDVKIISHEPILKSESYSNDNDGINFGAIQIIIVDIYNKTGIKLASIITHSKNSAELKLNGFPQILYGSKNVPVSSKVIHFDPGTTLYDRFFHIINIKTLPVDDFIITPGVENIYRALKNKRPHHSEKTLRQDSHFISVAMERIKVAYNMLLPAEQAQLLNGNAIDNKFADFLLKLEGGIVEKLPTTEK